MTIRDVANRWGVCERTVRRLLNLPAGRGLKAMRINRRVVRITQAALDAFEARRTV